MMANRDENGKFETWKDIWSLVDVVESRQ